MARRPRISEVSYRRDSSIARSIRAWTIREKPPSISLQIDVRSLSIFPSFADTVLDQKELQWYRWWLDQQLSTLLPVHHDCLLDTSHAPESPPVSQYITLFLEIADFFKTTTEPSIDQAIHHLVIQGLLKPVTSDGQDICVYRELLFGILGWQTMLYLPSFGTSPPRQLSVVCDFDGYQSQSFLAFKQDSANTKKPLSAFLIGFGLLIPPKNFCISEDPEEQQAFETMSIVHPQEFNAYLLDSIAHIKIRWVDTLSIHMEYNKVTNELNLFRYPSFCAVNLPVSTKNNLVKGVIHSCASESSDLSDISSNDVTDFLLEVLLSYRLLFGQCKASRQFFRQSMNSLLSQDTPPEGQDLLLALHCGRKANDLFISKKEKNMYRLTRDFPMLRCRIAVLKKQLANTKPRGWKELWKDKRDSAQWVTFWAVIVIGGLGLLLSLLQVILAFVQEAQIR